MYTNADCLHTKLSELLVTIDSLEHKPQIIAITEFKDKSIKDTLIQKYSISGYVHYYNDTFIYKSRSYIICR